MPAGPEIPEWADPRELDPAVRGALRGLDPRNAEKVAGHLVVAGTLVEEDPETALAHARAARDRASRLAVVREAVGVAAYHAEDYAEAARELRAYRRMSGDDSYRAVLADCERALGRADVALRLVAEALAESPDAEEIVELRLVEAGARRDLGEDAAARLVLEAALGGRPEPEGLDGTDEGQLRLAAAYADLLRGQGEEERADAWLAAVAAFDPELAGEDLGVEFSELDDDLAEDDLEDEDGAVVDEDDLDDVDEDSPLDDVDEDSPLDDVDEDSPLDDASDDGELDDEENEDVADAEQRPVAAAGSMTFDEEVEAEVAELLGENGPEGDSAN
ncbi:Replicase polyprotein 1ab [Blastococcus saxobsidens]|uniref:Replicase polyprotein 1ab n=1 Tax=Blastococcus saxobsidens TaxID=138336 RepID=A0A6L9W171_9ACTN|nr:Replicase polyprotein 1ab [Blastococcus saxobsidens]NEK85857.1 Replicase polyprotein 1ab [Blastococcus saxobsidens]